MPRSLTETLALFEGCAADILTDAKRNIINRDQMDKHCNAWGLHGKTRKEFYKWFNEKLDAWKATQVSSFES